MKIGRQLWVSAFAIGAMLMLAAGALVASPKAQFAIRWDLHGQPYGYADAWLAVLLVPAVSVALTALFAFAPRLLPPNTLERAVTPWLAVWTALLIAMCAAQAALVALNLGVAVNTPRLATLIFAGVFAFLGNYMGKIRYNHVIGFRTPWTVADARVWDKTHRFLGRAMVVCTAFLVAATFLTPAGRSGDLWILSGIFLCAFAPFVAAFVYSLCISPRAQNGAAS
ncbi:MAG TPA: SdpI family protein [Caulobacteraceae bacterium]|nr:SdpI family protein [Caulobacteraceae bacterium]